jgi:hypothetical protein
MVKSAFYGRHVYAARLVLYTTLPSVDAVNLNR